MRTVKILCKIFLGLFAVLVLAVLVNFIPSIRLAGKNMSVFVGDRVKVYYETEKEAAREVFDLAEKRAHELAERLGVAEKRIIHIYIYDSQKKMQTKKYGYIAALLGLDWYIGDNIGDNVILTSPAGHGTQHDYESVKNAVLHEIVHAYNYIINRDMTYWLDNGVAGYLSGQNPGDIKAYGPVPTLEQTRVKGLLAPVKFTKFNGYAYSYNYIEYLDKTYSWDKIRQLIRTGDFKSAFGAGEEEIYQGWVEYINR